jgi:aspartate/methionine/tyrosine aminotransferase
MVLARSREIVARNVAATRAFMEAHAGLVEWVPPRAGSVALPRFTALDAGEVSESLAQTRSVLLLPGSVFGAGPSHFRLGLGRRDLPAALDALSEHIRS